MDDSQFKRFSALAYELTGVTLDSERLQMLRSRVSSRMRATGLKDLDEYYDLVKTNDEERTAFVDKVTTHETSFFRTERVWAYLTETFFPTWIQAHPGKTCRIWSAASSSGEEAYSAAMLCHELASQNPGFRFVVEASDVSEPIVERCRTGVYQGRSIDRFRASRPEFFERYMQAGDGDAFLVREDIKQRVSFFTHNLFKRCAKQPYDLVLLRNVLIYFTADDQRQVIQSVKHSMQPWASLIIGESESLQQCEDILNPVAPFVYELLSEGQRAYG